jgi:hypothetical protein
LYRSISEPRNNDSSGGNLATSALRLRRRVRAGIPSRFGPVLFMVGKESQILRHVSTSLLQVFQMLNHFSQFEQR